MADLPSILHEDNDVLVIDKPAGMPSVSLTEGEQGTLAAWILEHFPAQAGIGNGMREAGLVHRLDNDTSGIVVAARSAEAFEHLRRQFEAGTVEKEYAALVVGHPPDAGDIEVPIAHHPRKKKKMVGCTSLAEATTLKARPAHTSFRAIEHFVGKTKEGAPLRYALLAVTIATGVRHQIRLHLASQGWPIAGDPLYRNPRQRAADALGLTRQFLHASRIAFLHPADNRRIAFAAPLPAELAAALAFLANTRRR